MRKRPGGRCLVSNEFMFGWPDEYTEDAAKVLAGWDVRVIAYIRRYDHWAVSAYAEETRSGMNMRGIDEYLSWLGPRVSAWPHLRKWGECFGWNRVRVRDMAALRGGDLLVDFLHELGLAMTPRERPPSNVAPHWIELELTRRLTERNGDIPWVGVGPAQVAPLLDELRPLIADAPPATYLSLAQRRSLVDLYNEDLEQIRRAGGPRLAPVRADLGAERPFAPSLAQVSDDVLEEFFARTSRPAFIAANPRAAERVRRFRAEVASRLDAAGGSLSRAAAAPSQGRQAPTARSWASQ
jgi:hypothetical protein